METISGPNRWMRFRVFGLGVGLALGLSGFLAATALAGVTPLSVGSAPRVNTVHPLRAEGDIPTAGPSEKWVTVEGRAPLTSGRSVARKQALLDAYRKAINEGGAIEIAEFSQLRNFKDVVDLVTKRSHGYIKKYEILADGVDSADSNTWMVAIRALVVDGLDRQMASDEGLAQFVTLIGSPRVLFVLASEDESPAALSGAGLQRGEHVDLEIVHQDTQVRIHQDQDTVLDLQGGVSADAGGFEISTAEQEMASHFRAVGYEVLTSDDVLNAGFLDLEDLAKARQGLGAFAAKVGRYVNADIVISGAIKYHVSSMSGGTDIGAHLGTVNLTAKAILPGSGRVLHVTTNRQRHMSVQARSELLAREEALARASRIAADELKWEIPKLLAQETRDVEIRLENISYDQSDEVRTYLSGLPGVESLYMAGWKDRKLLLTVKCVFTGPRESDLVQALQRKFGDLEVIEVANYHVVASL